MRSMTVVLALLFTATSGAAQFAAGDMIVLDYRLGRVWSVPPTGGFQLQATLRAKGPAMMSSPSNRAVWFAVATTTGTEVLSLTPSGAVSTAFRLPGQNRIMDLDDGGRVVLAGDFPALVRYDPVRRTLNTLDPSYRRLGQGGAIEPVQGDLIQTTSSRTIIRLRLSNLAVTTLAAAPLSISAMHYAPDANAMLVGFRNQLFELRLTLRPKLTPLGVAVTGDIFGIDRDPITGQFLIVNASPTWSEVSYYDNRTRTVTRSVVGQGVAAMNGVIAAGRTLAPLAVARRGQAFPMLVSSPRHAGFPYAVAVSLGITRGTPIFGGHRNYLAMDPLFWWSLSGAGIFRNFQGLLDARGEAVPALRIPSVAALQGLRFFAAVAVFNRVGVGQLVSEPIGATIR